MAELSYQEFYQNLLNEEHFIDETDIAVMTEFEKYVDVKWKEYLEANKPGRIQNVDSIQYFSTLQEKYIKGFNKECLYSLIPARIFFFQVLSLIFKDQKNIKLNFGNNNLKKIKPLIHFFWQQDTTTGKSVGMRYFIKSTEVLSTHIAAQEKLNKPHRFEIQDTSWTETQEVYLNHFSKIVVNKTFQYDFVSPPIKGIFEKADLISSEESAYLFNENRTDKNNISEILLNALENKKIKKTLVGWNGHETFTNANFIFSGLSRPTNNISKDFFNKGLFQRMLTYNRIVTTSMRENALRQVKNMYSCPDSYFQMLAVEFYDIYQWKKNVNPTILTFKDINKISSLCENAGLNSIANLNKEYKNNKEIRDGVIPFISRYYGSALYNLMALAALSRKSTVIEEQDFNEANYIIQECINTLKTFCERNMRTYAKPNPLDIEIRKQIEKYVLINKNNFFTLHDLILYIKNNSNQSITAIESFISEMESIKYLVKMVDDKYQMNKEDYKNLEDKLETHLRESKIIKSLANKTKYKK